MEEEEEDEKEKDEMNYPNKKKNAVCTDGNTVYIFTRECEKHMGHIHEESIRENTRTLVKINKNIV